MTTRQITTASTNRSRTAYNFIRNAIVCGDLPGRQFLNEGKLATRLGMSRTPIREALSQLRKDNLVEIVPGRGAFVREVSLDDLRDVYELRKVLECFAAEESVMRIADSEIESIERAWLAIDEAVRRGESVDYARISRLDNRFHALIIENCSNERLKSFMHLLNQEVLRYQLITASIVGDVEGTAGEHFRLTALLKQRDVAAFVAELRRHIVSSEEIVFSRHPRSTLWGGW